MWEEVAVRVVEVVLLLVAHEPHLQFRETMAVAVSVADALLVEVAVVQAAVVVGHTSSFSPEMVEVVVHQASLEHL